MTPDDYAKQRIIILEQTVRNLMAIVLETLPPFMGGQIDQLGRAWDKALDDLDAAGDKQGAQGDAS